MLIDVVRDHIKNKRKMAHSAVNKQIVNLKEDIDHSPQSHTIDQCACNMNDQWDVLVKQLRNFSDSRIDYES